VDTREGDSIDQGSARETASDKQWFVRPLQEASELELSPNGIKTVE